MNALHQQRRLAAQQFKRACGEQSGERWSLTDPQFNLREVAKQMVLLEDHLCQPHKHCPDCICKHLMTIEALAEEAVSMDQVGVYRETAGYIAETARLWMEHFFDQKPLTELGQQVRQVRKMLVQMVADPRQAMARVASRYMAVLTPCIHQRVATPPVG